MRNFYLSALSSAWPALCARIEIGLIKARNRLRGSSPQSLMDEAVVATPMVDTGPMAENWYESIGRWLNDPAQACKTRFTSTEILIGAIKMDVNKINRQRSARTRVGLIMSDLGWKKTRANSDGYRLYYYQRPEKPRARASNRSRENE